MKTPKPNAELKDELKQACDEFNRPDLHEPLSWMLNLEPRNRNLDQLLSAGTSDNYCIAANVMLYESKIDKARKYFEKALELPWSNTDRRAQLIIVIANLDITSKIARRYWELIDKGISAQDKLEPVQAVSTSSEVNAIKQHQT
jgi:tetratricopeptide (TPR) repeat protein